MPARKDEYAPIIAEYYKILDSWLAELPLPESWKSSFFCNKELQAKIFQSLIMYPFQAGELKENDISGALTLFWETKDYAKKEIPLYNCNNKILFNKRYAEERHTDPFLVRIYDTKTNIRARTGNHRHSEIPLEWRILISNTVPWLESESPRVPLLLNPYIDLLERICLQATEKEQLNFAEEFPYIKNEITSSDYFCDLFFALGRDFEVSPSRKYVSHAAVHLAALLRRCGEFAEVLVKSITQKYEETKLQDALTQFGGGQPLSRLLDTAYNLQTARLEESFKNADVSLFHKDASENCTFPLWYLYQQYFVSSRTEPSSSTDMFFLNKAEEINFCTLMSKELSLYKMPFNADNPDDSKRQSVFDYYLEQTNKAALLLYLGVHFHFKSGSTQLFKAKEEIQISSKGDYILPAKLPLTMKSLRIFTNNHNPCLLCGGSGSGKSTYLKKIVELHETFSKSFSLVVNIPLRFLVSDSTPQLDSIEPTLETSLTWQRARQSVLQKNPSQGEEILADAEANLTRLNSGVAPILLLLDGYNEILNIQNEMALERLRQDIKWLSSKNNIRILMTYRTEQTISETEIRRSMSWLFSPGREKVAVFYIAYDKAKMMKLLEGSWVLSRKVPHHILQLLESRPMYLFAARNLEQFSQVTQYALLDSIYSQRCQAGLDSPLIRDGKKSRWMVLYYILLPELAYYMVASGNQVLERHVLHREIRKILTGHNASRRDCESIGNLYWWNTPETSGEIGSYPFNGSVNEEDISWIEGALLGSDKILDRDETGAISFFHEDILNYLAARHIALRLRLYIKCAPLSCCYSLPVRWERIPTEMRALVYEALAFAFGIQLESPEKTAAIQILEELIFPSASMTTLPEAMLPGHWMRLKMASQIQEYEKQNRSEVMEAFVSNVKPLADSCLNSKDLSLDQEAQNILSWTFCRLSQFERLDGKHPVPQKAFEYALSAVNLAPTLPAVPGEPSQLKIANHYLAKTFLYQAQYLWTQCPEEDWPKADLDFLRGYSLLKECAAGDRENAGFNLSNNLLGLWKYSPAPYLQKKLVFQEASGEVEYASAFGYFLRSVAFAPAKSANRPYAATKCVAMLLEQQVFLSESVSFSSLEELLVKFCNDQKNVMTAKTAGHEVLPLWAPELKPNLKATGFLLKEIDRFTVDEYSYYKGLYLLYSVAQGRLEHTAWSKAEKEFEGDQKNPLKNTLCLGFIDTGRYLVKGHKRKAKAVWKISAAAFQEKVQEELREISPDEKGSLDAGHRIHNQAAYKNLLSILSSSIEESPL